MKTQEEVNNIIAKMSNEEKALFFPPIEIKNFVVRKSWLGRNQVITFVNNKKQRVTYNHDVVLNAMLPKLSTKSSWIKRGYWSQSKDMPTYVRGLAEFVDIEYI